jgi:phytoene synthase
MTPEQYVQNKAAASGSSFYYAFLVFAAKPSAKPSPPSTPFAARWTMWSMRSHDPEVAARTLQWWSREVSAAFAGNPSHPVLQALMPHTSAYGIQRGICTR